MQKQDDKIFCLWSFTEGRQSFPWTINSHALKWCERWDSGAVHIKVPWKRWPPGNHVLKVLACFSSSSRWWQKNAFSHSRVSGLLYSSASQLDLDQMEKKMSPSHCLSLSFSCVWDRESWTMCIEDRQSHKHEASMCCHAAYIDRFVSDWSSVSMHSSHIISLLMSLTSSTYSFTYCRLVGGCRWITLPNPHLLHQEQVVSKWWRLGWIIMHQACPIVQSSKLKILKYKNNIYIFFNPVSFNQSPGVIRE